MGSVEFWDYFEARVRQQFPDKISLLPAGADAKAIAQAERTMQIEFPSAVREFYRRHNGSGSFYLEPWVNGGGPLYFVSLDNMTSTWKMMCEIGEDFEKTEPEFGFGSQEGPIKRRYWNPRAVPITENQCGDNILLDLDPAEGGTIGQMVDWWHEGGVSKWVSKSFLDWLQDIRRAIDEGTMHIGA